MEEILIPIVGNCVAAFRLVVLASLDIDINACDSRSEGLNISAVNGCHRSREDLLQFGLRLIA